jgi:hypothetical protein
LAERLSENSNCLMASSTLKLRRERAIMFNLRGLVLKLAEAHLYYRTRRKQRHYDCNNNNTSLSTGSWWESVSSASIWTLSKREEAPTWGLEGWGCSADCLMEVEKLNGDW